MFEKIYHILLLAILKHFKPENQFFRIEVRVNNVYEAKTYLENFYAVWDTTLNRYCFSPKRSDNEVGTHIRNRHPTVLNNGTIVIVGELAFSDYEDSLHFLSSVVEALFIRSESILRQCGYTGPITVKNVSCEYISEWETRKYREVINMPPKQPEGDWVI